MSKASTENTGKHIGEARLEGETRASLVMDVFCSKGGRELVYICSSCAI